MFISVVEFLIVALDICMFIILGAFLWYHKDTEKVLTNKEIIYKIETTMRYFGYSLVFLIFIHMIYSHFFL